MGPASAAHERSAAHAVMPAPALERRPWHLPSLISSSAGPVQSLPHRVSKGMLAGAGSSGGRASPARPTLQPSKLQLQLQAAEQRAQAAQRRAEAADRTVALLHVQIDEQQTLLEREASRAADELARAQLLQAEVEGLWTVAAGGSAAADLRQRLVEAERALGRLRQELAAERSALREMVAVQARMREELDNGRSALFRVVAAEARLQQDLAAERAVAARAAQESERQLASMARMLAELQEAAAVGKGVQESVSRLAGIAVGAAHASSSSSVTLSSGGESGSSCPSLAAMPPRLPAVAMSAAAPAVGLRLAPVSMPALPQRLPSSSGAGASSVMQPGMPKPWHSLWLGNILVHLCPSSGQLLRFFSPFGSIHSDKHGTNAWYIHVQCLCSSELRKVGYISWPTPLP